MKDKGFCQIIQTFTLNIFYYFNRISRMVHKCYCLRHTACLLYIEFFLSSVNSKTSFPSINELSTKRFQRTVLLYHLIHQVGKKLTLLYGKIVCFEGGSTEKRRQSLKDIPLSVVEFGSSSEVIVTLSVMLIEELVLSNPVFERIHSA